MKHWIDYIRSTEYTTYQALNILHMKHWKSSEIDSANLILILHFLKILMRLSTNSKKRYRFCIQRYKSLKKLRKINRLTFSTFIQLKMRHDYFKSYLHRLSKNNLNKCYEICKARQTLKHLLLNCKHYRAEQLQLKAKAQFKNMNIILTLFIIKIERIIMLKYLKSTWIATRKWLLKMKK